MKGFRADTMTNLHSRMADWFISATPDDLVVTSIDVQRTNVIATADSMVWDYDLKDVWLTKSRWNTMVRQYVNADRVMEWLDKASILSNGKRGIAVLRSNEVAPRSGRGGEGTVRKWGSCMLTWSYRAFPEPEFTMHSRTGYLGYLSPLDLSVAWHLANTLGYTIGTSVEEMKFTWFVEVLQWHHFKSLAYILNHPDPEEREYWRHQLSTPGGLSDSKLKELRPVEWGSRKWTRSFLKDDANGLTYGDMTYNTFRRVRRRYHTEILGYDYAKQFEGMYYNKHGEGKMMAAFKPLPHQLVSNLDLSAIGIYHD